MIVNQAGHIPSPLNTISCSVLRHAVLDWQKNKHVHPKGSKSKVKRLRPDRSSYFIYMNDSCKIASCCCVMVCKLLTSRGIADTYTGLMNIWNTLLESYQLRVYKNTLATAKHQVQQGENSTPAVVISVNAAHVDNAILFEYLTSKVALEQPEIGSTDQHSSLDNNCKDHELHFGRAGD